jgi:hypothetical protein
MPLLAVHPGEHLAEELKELNMSAASLLLGAGLTCFGAMFLRSRFAKPTHPEILPGKKVWPTLRSQSRLTFLVLALVLL